MRERMLPPSKPKTESTSYIIFDLDGVLLRWVNAHLPNVDDQTSMFQEIRHEQENGTGLAVLTNRPPGQMSAIAYTLGVNYGYWVTESGGSIYDVYNHRAYVAPEWVRIARERVPRLREFLEERFGVSTVPEDPSQPQYEPGMGFVKTVIIPPEETSIKDLAEEIQQALSQTEFADEFVVEAGKAIDIYPKGLSKAAGMALLLTINGIDPKIVPTLFVADHARDIPAAQVLHDAGGTVAAVGNSAPSFKDAVSASGGIVAPEDSSYHSSVTHILTSFRRSLDSQL